jgi:hypothetical protein
MSKFKFAYVPVEDLNRRLSAGPAAFEVTKALEASSKKGDPMLEIKLDIIDQYGTKKEMTEYLLGTEKMMWKLHAFLRAIKREHLYTPEGTIDPDMLLGGVGDCELDEKTEEYQGRETKKTIIKSYIDPNAGVSAEEALAF